MAALAVSTAARSACAAAEQAPAGASGTVRDFYALLGKERFSEAAADVARWRELIARAQAEPRPNAEVIARSQGWLAWTLDYLSQVDEAVVAGRQAMATLDAAHQADGPFASDILAALSIAETDSGLTDPGRAHAEQAVALVNRYAPESSQASMAQNALAGSYYNRGEYEAAERHYGLSSALALRCMAPDDPFIVNETASHAGVLYMVGRSEDALAENERAANWALGHLKDSNPVITLALGNLGVMLRSAGRYAEAEAALRRVVDLEARYQKDSYYYRAISLSNFASVIDRQGRHLEAEALWIKSNAFHKLSTTKRDPVQAAYPLRFSADSAQARGDLALALARRREALALSGKDTPADHPELARARIEYGMTLTLIGRAGEGLAVADPAIAVVRAKLAPTDVKRITAEIDHARIVAAARGAEAGYALIAPIARRLEVKLLDSSTSRGDLLRYGPSFSASFANVTGLALATGRDDEAFHWLQLANLSDVVLVSAEVAARAALADPAARALARTLQDQIRQRQALDRKRSFAASDGQPAALAAVEAAIVANDAAIADTARRLETAYPAFRNLGRPAPVALAAMRARLLPGQILVAPLPLDDGTLAIAVTRDGLTWSKTAMRRWMVADAVAHIRRAVDGGGAAEAFPTDDARALYDALLPPSVSRTFAARPAMLYYASGPLATLPPALLVAPGRGGQTRWLIRSHSVTVLPMLAAAQVVTGDVRRAAFLGIGAPEGATPTGLSPLPRAAAELRRMAAQIGGERQLLLGRDASEAAVKAANLGRFSVIAFATHGLGGEDLAGGAEPALVLAPAATDDGLLTASEIAGLRIDADWVILSACNSASGQGAGTPAYSGLASAFIAAGARALLVSHWPVRDDAADAITTATLRGVGDGLGRAEALRRAMLALMASKRVPGAADPAVWAPFVLVER